MPGYMAFALMSADNNFTLWVGVDQGQGVGGCGGGEICDGGFCGDSVGCSSSGGGVGAWWWFLK